MRSVGIDLGTTNSVCACINENGQVEIIPNIEGGRITPSVFAITEDMIRLVGKPAIDQESSNPKCTIRSIKRKMGTNERLSIGNQILSPEEISSEILRKIKLDAENYLNDEVINAVITVPAYFNSDQRKATITAGMLAGLNVLRIINEPTAASLAYGLDKNKNEMVLVIDLGGGTFDVTVLQITPDGVFEVKSTSGDTYLGGDDWDTIIKNKIEELITNDFGENVTLFDDAPSRIREAAEGLKIQLTSSNIGFANLNYLGISNGKPVNIKFSMTRKDFELLSIELMSKIRTSIFQSLNDAHIAPEDIDEVVFVGGSTRMPIVSKSVEDWLHKKPNRSINPDEAVAIGAAIQAALLTGEKKSDLLLLDVIPLSLGVETLGGVMTTMISRNTTVPTDYKSIFSTAEDNQDKVSVRVYQGERPQVKNNKFLGEFQLTDILPAPRGVPQIELTFDVDANGILSVSALDKATDKAQNMVISGSSSLNDDDIGRIIEDAKKYEEEDKIFKERMDIINALDQQLIQIREISTNSKDDIDEAILASLLAKGIIVKEYYSDNKASIETLRELSLEIEQLINETSEMIYEKADEFIMGE
jgi:molecular chaperone DnaK